MSQLPEQLLVEVWSRWLDWRSIVRFDSACCSRPARDFFLRALKDIHLNRDCCEYKSDNEYLEAYISFGRADWICRRGVKMNSVLSCILDFDGCRKLRDKAPFYVVKELVLASTILLSSYFGVASCLVEFFPNIESLVLWGFITCEMVDVLATVCNNLPINALKFQEKADHGRYTERLSSDVAKLLRKMEKNLSTFSSTQTIVRDHIHALDEKCSELRCFQVEGVILDQPSLFFATLSHWSLLEVLSIFNATFDITDEVICPLLHSLPHLRVCEIARQRHLTLVTALALLTHCLQIETIALSEILYHRKSSKLEYNSLYNQPHLLAFLLRIPPLLHLTVSDVSDDDDQAPASIQFLAPFVQSEQLSFLHTLDLSPSLILSSDVCSTLFSKLTCLTSLSFAANDRKRSDHNEIKQDTLRLLSESIPPSGCSLTHLNVSGVASFSSHIHCNSLVNLLSKLPKLVSLDLSSLSGTTAVSKDFFLILLSRAWDYLNISHTGLVHEEMCCILDMSEWSLLKVKRLVFSHRDRIIDVGCGVLPFSKLSLARKITM